MSTPDDLTVDLRIYACPTCKGVLQLKNGTLNCQSCQAAYPIVDGIPDFILENLTRSTDPVLRTVKAIDMLVRIYEAKPWYPVILNLYGGLGTLSLEEFVCIVTKMVELDKGLILDVACGPGTFGRRMASESKPVYGIDISMAMIRQGVAYIKRDYIPNVHFARAKAEALPFHDAVFDAVLCCGSLPLFRDTVATLREIGRTMKDGAPLAATTFVVGNKGILRFRFIREHLQQNHGAHIFEVQELEECLAKACFEEFRPQLYGSLLVFGARKRNM